MPWLSGADSLDGQKEGQQIVPVWLWETQLCSLF